MLKLCNPSDSTMLLSGLGNISIRVVVKNKMRIRNRSGRSSLTISMLLPECGRILIFGGGGMEGNSLQAVMIVGCLFPLFRSVC